MESLEILLEQAIEASGQGEKDEAIRIYQKILSEKEDWSTVHYNLGLIYKYRNEWDKSYYHNKRAVALDPTDEASQWNLGIAATMLEDWMVARQCWNFFGMEYDVIDKDTAGNIGDTVIRISPHANPETVWAMRICPARAIINSIPFPASEHQFKDMVLNDGAPNGYRMSDGKEYSVFDEIQYLLKSEYLTFSIKCKPVSHVHFENLQRRCHDSDIAMENWSEVKMLCTQCSEGKPHETHDHELENPTDEMKIAFASASLEKLEQVLDSWCVDTGNEYYEARSY